MKIITKKILRITDDQDNLQLGTSCYSSNIEYTGKVINKFQFLKSYDAILIDYGMMGNFKNSVDILRKYYFAGIPMFWCGGLSSKYEDDCKKVFPDIKFLHQIKSIELQDPATSLDRYFWGTDDYEYKWVDFNKIKVKKQ